MKKWRLWAVCLVAVLLAGCATTKLDVRYPHAGADDGAISRDLLRLPQDLRPYARQVGDSPLLGEARQVALAREFVENYYAPWKRSSSLFQADEVFYMAKSHPQGRLGYAENVRPITRQAWQALLKNANRERFPSRNAHGITVCNTALRAMPTHKPFFKSPAIAGEGYPFDYFSHSALWAGSPVYISHGSADGLWLFVETQRVSGWVPHRDVAFVDEDFKARWRSVPLGAVVRDGVVLAGEQETALEAGGASVTGLSDSPSYAFLPDGSRPNGTSPGYMSPSYRSPGGISPGYTSSGGAFPAGRSSNANPQGGIATGNTSSGPNSPGPNSPGPNSPGKSSSGDNLMGAIPAGTNPFGMLHVGTLLPLRGDKVLYPVRDVDGKALLASASLRKAYLSPAIPGGDEGVVPPLIQPFPLPLTAHALAEIGNVMMGQPYGWGGSLENRDCSALMMDIYTPFGLWLPRNSSQQGKAGRVVSLDGLRAEEKITRIRHEAKPFATLIWLPGHIVLYVGEYEGTPSIYHDIWGITIADETGAKSRAVIGKVAVTSLSPGLEHSLLSSPAGILDRMGALVLLGE